MKQEQGQDAVAGEARSVVVQAQMRRSSYRNVIDIVDDGGISNALGHTAGKRKADAQGNKMQIVSGISGLDSEAAGNKGQSSGSRPSKKLKQAKKAAQSEASNAVGFGEM